jgi:hypothetical protein
MDADALKRVLTLATAVARYDQLRSRDTPAAAVADLDPAQVPATGPRRCRARSPLETPAFGVLIARKTRVWPAARGGFGPGGGCLVGPDRRGARQQQAVGLGGAHAPDRRDRPDLVRTDIDAGTEISTVRTGILMLLGLLLVVVGGTWTFQGLGYLSGSPMTGVAAWAIIGPLVAGLGVALVIVAVRGGRGKSPHS